MIPKNNAIAGAWNERQTPSFPLQRKIWYGFGASPTCARDLADWERHNRMGGPIAITIGHTWHGLDPKRDFEKHYLPFCRRMEFDNQLGRFLFKIAGVMRKTRFARRAILRMVSEEQRGEATDEGGMSAVIWDMLTGGAPFAEVLKGASRPAFLLRLLWHMLVSLIFAEGRKESTNEQGASLPQAVSDPQVNEVNTMSAGSLGRMYRDGEIIVRQGELGDCMYVVQDGAVEVFIESEDQQIQLNILGKDEFFGEMAIFDHEFRSATVRALGPARILTIDHRNFLQRIHEDPSLAYRLMQVMSERVRRLSGEVAQLRQSPVPTHGQSED